MAQDYISLWEEFDMTEPKPPQAPAFTQLSPEAEAARAARNRWLGLALFGFVILVGIITAVRLAATVKESGAEFYYHVDDTSSSIPDDTTALPPGMTPEEPAHEDAPEDTEDGTP